LLLLHSHHLPHCQLQTTLLQMTLLGLLRQMLPR
jgi:hypothetical protein